MDPRNSRRRTKIICTLGPSSSSFLEIERLARSGMNCARLNFSHGTLSDHLKLIKNVREVAKNLGRQIAVMQDLPGPKIRVGEIKGGALELKRGQVIYLESKGASTKNSIPVLQENLPKYVPSGAVIFLADGTIRLEVMEKTRTSLKCKCLNGGTLLSGKGVNIPDLQRSFQGFTDLDKKYLEFGLKQFVDIVAISFIRTSKEMHNVREFIGNKTDSPPWIVSKIERREALTNLDAIIVASDAVMVARGDLGVENPIEQVPIIQKMIISKCNERAIPVITATQMLESMVSNPRPTRAEATDAANAVLDGSDALMLSEETAIGSYPVECVKVLDRVARLIEAWKDPKRPEDGISYGYAAALAQASTRLAKETGSKIIVCGTKGNLPCQIAREKPGAEIVPLAKDELTANRYAIVRDVFPIVATNEIDYTGSIEKVESTLSRMLLRKNIVKAGDKIVLASDSVSSSGQLLLALTIREP